MKKLLLLVLPASFLLSCSADENIVAENQPSSDALAKAARIAWDVQIPVPKLFTYESAQEAAVEMQKSVALLTSEIRQELARRPECDHAIFAIHLYRGHAGLGSLVFGDSREGVFRQRLIILNSEFAPHPRLIHDASSYKKCKEFTKEHCQQFSNAETDNELVKFLTGKLSGADAIAEFELEIDAETSTLYGYKG